MSGQARNGPVTAGVGWLDGSAKTPKPEEVLAVVESRFGRPFEVAASGFYGHALAVADGVARVEWDGRGGAAGTTRVEVKQSALDQVGLPGSVALLRDLSSAGYRPSRVDCWIDDSERRMTPALVRDAVLSGQAVTHARPGRYWRDDLDGRETYYLGRPASDRLVRCYDRPDGQVRMELAARRQAADHAAAVVLAAGLERQTEAVMSNVISFVDFRQSKERSDGSRRPRLDWWSAVVGDTARAEAAPSQPRPSLEELALYFRDHWSRSLAEMYRAYGPRWLNSVLRHGFDRLDESDSEREDVA